MSTAAVTPDQNPTPPAINDVAPPTAPNLPPPSAPTPTQTPAAPQKPALWKGVVIGALRGMAASAGGHSLGEGLALGAGGELAGEQQDRNNAASEDAAKQAQVKAAADLAHTQALTSQVMRAVNNLPDNHIQAVIEGRAKQTEDLRKIGSLIPAGEIDLSPDHHVALEQVTALSKANPGKLYSAEPITGPDGKIGFQAMQSTDAPLPQDVPLLDINGQKAGTLPKGLPGTKATQLQVLKLQQGISDLSAKNANDKLKAQAAMVKAGAAKTATDKKGAESTEWKPKVTADEKKKAELAENIAVNAEAVAATLQKRPDLVGAIAGRFTSFEQMAGNNDPDISAIATHIHNLAMANSGVHGFRSHEGVVDNEKQLFNNFKNGPKAVGGALKASVQSVQTFIDNARPETYKTHSKMGGVLKGMAQ